MVDEIELLAQFRAEVPGPSPQARAQAWAAVIAAAAEEATVAPVPARPRKRRSAAGRHMAALVAAVVALVTVLGAVLFVSKGANHAPGTFTTAWQPSRPASRLAIGASAGNRGGALQLVSYVEGPDWKKASSQVPPGYLDCPAVDACYLVAQTETSPVEPYANYYNSVYFSGDGGHSWSSLALPKDLELSTALSCPSARACAGVGYQGDKNELVSTTDGGHRWLVRPLRAPADVMSLSCSSVSNCSLVSESSYLGPGHPQQFASTSNGGATWYVHNFPRHLYISSLSCPSAGDCIAIASSAGTGTGTTFGLGAGVALVTTDSGRSWSRSPLPGGAATPLAPTDPGDLSLLSCSDDSNCVLFGGVTVTYSLQGLQRLPRQCPPDGCVLHEEATWQPDVASTANGGRDWHAVCSDQPGPRKLQVELHPWRTRLPVPGHRGRSFQPRHLRPQLHKCS